MMYGFMIYVTVGFVILVFSGGLRNLLEDIKDLKASNYLLWDICKKVLFCVFKISVDVLLCPIVPILWLIEKLLRKKAYSQTPQIEYDGNLYLSKRNGAGMVCCEDCDFKAEAFGFVHGFGSPRLCKVTLQCQECGQFKEVEGQNRVPRKGKCQCGGKLSREAPVFCPSCKSKNMNYHLRYMT
jgi:hypothetical protein